MPFQMPIMSSETMKQKVAQVFLLILQLKIEASRIAFKYYFFSFSVNASLFMSAKLDAKLAMLVGNCTAWSMAFSLMVRCPSRKEEYAVTIPTPHSLQRLEMENMCQEVFLSTLNHL